MSVQEIRVPDLGGTSEVEVVELSVSVGQSVKAEDTLIVVESDKATVELPSPLAGQVTELCVKLGDRLRQGDLVARVESSAGASAESGAGASAESSAAPPPQIEPTKPPAAAEHAPGVAEAASMPAAAGVRAEPVSSAGDVTPPERVHAGPSVRKLAREFGVELGQVPGTGPHQRVLKTDVQQYVKRGLQGVQGSASLAGSGIPAVKLPDFALFGRIERRPLSRMQVLTAESMQRSWLNVPHVTQFDEADITELEAFRLQQKPAGEVRGLKLTPLPFLLRACAQVLQELPQFNVALDMDKHELVQKHYVHIGLAVDTPAGLVVPVIRDAGSKSIWALAAEAQALAEKARQKKLTPGEMQGACFTITSLGGIGGTAFIPIVNSPEVAILGVSRAAMKPVWQAGAFVPRLMLPLSLSYDHRAVNGADGARFTARLGQLLGDIRELLM